MYLVFEYVAYRNVSRTCYRYAGLFYAICRGYLISRNLRYGAAARGDVPHYCNYVRGIRINCNPRINTVTCPDDLRRPQPLDRFRALRSQLYFVLLFHPCSTLFDIALGVNADAIYAIARYNVITREPFLSNHVAIYSFA